MISRSKPYLLWPALLALVFISAAWAGRGLQPRSKRFNQR